jgi:hypothetical protein
MVAKRNKRARTIRPSAKPQGDTDEQRRWSLRRKEFTLLVVSIIVGLAAAEIIARTRLHFSPRPGHTYLHGLPTGEADLFSDNPRGTLLDVRKHQDFAFEYGGDVGRALSKGHYFGVQYRRNSLGMRDREMGPPAQGVRRIGFVGDSFTFGEGVHEPDTYPRVFERLMHEAGRINVEVVNCSQPGIDILRVEARVRHLCIPLGISELYYGYVLNDPIEGRRFKKSTARKMGQLMRYEPGKSEYGPIELINLARHAYRQRATNRWTIDWYRRLHSPENDGFEQSLRSLEEMNVMAKKHGVAFRVIIWPLFHDLDGDYPFSQIHDTMRQACERLGIPYLDLLATFAGKNAEKLWITSFNAHPGTVAHDMAGQAIAKWRQSTP